MKKIISLLVVLAMLMSMAPAVFATETTEYREVTIPEAIELAELNDGNKYLVRGTVTEVANATYGNLYIEDAEGNSLYVYGVYGVDGVDRYDAMETKPVEGDEVVLLGILTTYNSNPQMKNAWLQELNGEAFEAPETEPDPEADTELTIAEAIALGKSKAHNTYTEGKYYVTGEVTEIYNTTYGNMYIQDAEGNVLTVYGTYDADGTNRFDAMENQPAVGDTITVYGIIGQYNGTPQMKNGWIQEDAGEEPETPAVEPTLFLGNNELFAADYASSEYVYVAEQTGTLYITLRSYTCDGIEYGAEMLDYGWSELFINGERLKVTEKTLEVVQGDVITVQITSDMDEYVAWLDLSYEGFYEEPVGSKLNPIYLTPEQCPTTAEIPAGEELYYSLDYGFSEHVLYIYGENAYIVYEGWNENGEWGDIYVYAVDGVVTFEVWQYEIRIGNAGDTDATFEVDAVLPVGLENNPAQLVIGENVTEMSASMWGYHYIWTAEEAGTLTITVSGGPYWAFRLQNVETAQEFYYWEIDNQPNTASVNVNAGDVVLLMLRLHEPVEWESIDGTLTVLAEFAPEGGGEDAEPGTEANPIEIVFEMNETYTVGTATATVEAGETTHYVAYGVGGMLLTVTDAEGNVVKTEILPGNPRMPAPFSLTNDGETEMTYTLTVTYPAGTYDNPAELVLGYTSVEVDGNGYFYTWTATEDTLLALGMLSNNWTYSFMVEHADGTYTYTDIRYSDDKVPVQMTVLKLTAGDVVNLTVGTADWSEATVEFTANTYAGDASNPVYLPLIPNEAYTAWALNADLPAGEYVYSMDILSTMFELTVNGELTAYTADPMGWDPATAVINNTEEANAVFTIEVKYPSGTMFNPTELELGYNEAEMLMFDGLSHAYVYTATEDTLLAIELLGENWYYWGAYMKEDGSPDYARMTATYAADDADYGNPVVPVTVVKLAAGESFMLYIGCIDGSEFVEFNANTYAGTAENPVYLPLRANDAYTAWALNADLPAGEYVYSMDILSTMFELTVNGELTTYTADPMGWDPATAVINNTEEANAVFTVEVNYPNGTMFNPTELELGYNEAEMLMFDGLSHAYVYTATEDTLLLIELMGESWYYWGAYMKEDGSPDYARMTATYAADDADYGNPVVPVTVVKLAAGESFMLYIGSIDGTEIIEFNAMTYAGTEEDPIMVNFTWNDDGTAASLNADLPAGEYVYGARGLAGTVLTVNGVETEVALGASMRNPDTFVINNTEEMNAVFTLELTYPEGTWMNPDVVEGEEEQVVADLPEGSDGYYIQWIAPANGTLTVTVNSDGGWRFSVDNETAGVYGEVRWSDDNPVVNVQTIQVKAGDVIMIIACTYDPENPWPAPAGQLTIDLLFTPVATELGDVNGDGAIDTTDAKLIMQYDLGLIDETGLELAAADVNGDGAVDTTDAKLIMQYDLGLIEEF